jgi:hypothetical protein
VPLDAAVVALIAERQDQANQACSDASYLRTAAIAMFVFLGLSLIPFLPLVYWAFVGLFIGVLVMLIRWQVKFGSLITGDPDYVRAKRFRTLALILWIAAIPLGFVVRPLIDLIIARLL